MKRIFITLVVCLTYANIAYAVPKVPDIIKKSDEQKKAIALLRSEQYQKAKELVENQLQKAPNTPELLMILGYSEAGLKNWGAAKQHIEEAMKYSSQDEKNSIRFDLANIYYLEGNTAKAEQLYQEVLNIKPQAKVIETLIRIYMKQDQYGKAISLTRQIQKSDPDSGNGYYYEALVIAQKSSSNYKDAISLLQKAVQKNSQNTQFLYMLGYLYLKTGQYAKGIPILKEVLKKKPDAVEIYRMLAVASLQQKDIQTAIQYLEKEILLKPSAEAYHLIGKLYLQIGQKESGINALNKASETASLKSEESLAEKGLYDYLEGDLVKSESKLKQSLSEDKPENHILLIVNLLNQLKYKEAVSEAQSALNIYPQKQEIILNLLAQAYLSESKFEDAEKALKKASELKPDFPLTHINLSALYFQQGKYEKTREELKQILSLDPNHLQANLLLSRAYQASSQYGQADDILQKLLKNASSQTVAQKELILLKIKTKHFEEALKLSDQMTESMEKYLLKSRIYANMGNFSDALDNIDSGLEKIGDNLAALATGAHLAARNHQYSRCLNYLERCKSKYGLERSDLQSLYREAKKASETKK